MATKNVLTAPEVYKLTQWLDQNPIPCQTLTQPELALLATSVLRFNVTPANCVMAGKNLGIEVGKQNYIVKTNRNATQVLASCIYDVYLHLGLLVPSDLDDLRK